MTGFPPGIHVPYLRSFARTSLRIPWVKSLQEKKKSIRVNNKSFSTRDKYTLFQNNLLFIPETPFVYWLNSQIFDLLKSDYRLSNIANVRAGLQTSNNERFVRCFWEVTDLGIVLNGSPIKGHWFKYAKGGRYQKWKGLEWLVINWMLKGEVIKTYAMTTPGTTHWSRNVRSESYYFKKGLTYTLMARGSFAARLLDDAIFDVAGISIFPQQNITLSSVAALTATHIISYLLRVTTQDLKFHAGYVANLPIPVNIQYEILDCVGQLCIALKEILVENDPIEMRFNIHNRGSTKVVETVLHTLEGWNEKIVSGLYELGEQDIQTIFEETGIPAGWHPLIANYETLPTLPNNLDFPPLPQELFNYLTKHERVNPDKKELKRIKANLRALYEAGPGAKNVEQEEANNADEDSEEEIASGAHIPIPTETFLEELSVKMQIHPISVYWLLEELRAKGVRCLPEERRILEDRLSVLILRLLGHRWPQQIEAGEPVPTWAVRNGIIPLVSSTGKRTLAERLRERLREEDGDIGAQQTEALLEELTGQSLEEWLRRRFFSRHVSQFKSRPVAWHLASTPGKMANGKGKKSRGGGIQRKPAFECILYYHACTTNALARIRNEYVEPLILAERGKIAQGKNETEEEQPFHEESAIDDTASAIASERIRELNAFADRLRTIEEQGFKCDELKKSLATQRLDRWSGDGYLPPLNEDELLRQEESWHVDSNDGVRVNIAPLQLAHVLASDVLKVTDARKAIADRARWRSDERRWVREGKLPRCGWMEEQVPASSAWNELEPHRIAEQQKLEQKRLLLQQGKQIDEVNGVEEEEVFQ